MIHLSLRKGMTPTAAHTIARRFRAAVVHRAPATEIIFSDGGIITTGDLRRLLEPRIGRILTMRLRPAPSGEPNVVLWEALNERAEVVTGRVVLHVTLDEMQITVWADLLV
ncbi:unnamed protein product, partial [marine sediment metagenome]